MQRHPNEFTRHLINRYFRERHVEAEVLEVEKGYVIFFHRFSPIEACDIRDPTGRLVYDNQKDDWRLYWMSGRIRWHLYGRYDKLEEALGEMFSDRAASLFHKVL